MDSPLNAGHFRNTAVWLGGVCACLALPVPLSAQAIKPRATLRGHTGIVISLAFSTGGNTLASGSRDNSLKLWDVPTGRNLTTLNEAGVRAWCSVAFSPDCKTLASAAGGHKIRLWDVAASKSISFPERKSMNFPRVVFSPNGKLLASGGRCGGDIILWEVSTGKDLATLAGYPIDGVSAMTFTPDGTALVSMGYREGLKRWDVPTGKHTSTLKLPEVRSAAFSPDSKLLATGNRDGTGVTLWEVATARKTAAFTGPTDGAWSVVFSPDGQTLACGMGEGTIKLWDLAAGKERITLQGHTGKVWSLAYSPDGRLLASGGEDKLINLWDLTAVK